MIIAEMVTTLTERGVAFSIDNGRLRVENAHRLTRADRVLITQKKSELVKHLLDRPNGHTLDIPLDVAHLDHISFDRNSAAPAIRLSAGSDPWLDWAPANLKSRLWTPWLLPYDDLIKAAQAGQLPPLPQSLRLNVRGYQTVEITDVTYTVLTIASIVAAVATMARGRANRLEETALVQSYSAILGSIQDWWRMEIREC